MTRNTLIRRTALTTVAAVATLVLAACGADSGTSAGASGGGMSDMPGMSQSSAPSAKSWNDADVAFAQMMIPDHQMVASMAELAEKKASNAELKKLATQMKAGQTEAVTKLTGWLQAWGKPTTGDMAGMKMPGAMTDADMTNLKSLSGMNFDMKFAQLMIAHHNGSLQMARDEQTNGASAEAKAMADAMVKTLAQEVTALQKFASM